ncbi:MAG TPA: ABC transporter permease [Gemmatimonadaceae bacterium]|nr:ABC transporter permease [Gemmatimonadaceae bacterium]
MPSIRRLARKLKRWALRHRIEAAMDAEMRDHLEREIAEHVAHGVSRDEATRLARRDFGGVERYKEEARDVLGIRLLDDAGRDFQYALRLLHRNPGFTVGVVLTFALGIGCTAAIFTLVDGILLRPLPYAQPNELVALWERNVPRALARNVISVSLFEAWRDHTRSFTGIAAMTPAPRTLQGAPAERISAAQVSPSYFRILGVHPALGRDFTNADEQDGGTSVTILSDAFWRTHFGADSSIIGRAIVMDGESYRVVGVMPPDFEPARFGWMTEHPLWIPFAPTAGNRSWGRFLHAIARLRPGIPIDQARAELAALSERRSREEKGDSAWSSSIVPLSEQLTGDVRRPLLTLFGAVALLLLMSIVNVASLVTTFTRRRQHELVLRRAIGATPLRLLRQQLALSAALAVAATVIGLAVALAATRGLVALMPPDVPRLTAAHVDGTVVVFTIAVASVTTLVIGIASTSLGTVTRRTSLDLATTRVTTRLRGARLVSAEIAIGLVLSLLATLMIRSFVKLESVDLGFQPANVAVGRVSLPSAKYPTEAQWRQFFDGLRQRAGAIPGVTSVSIATTSPFACCAPSTNVGDAARVADPRAPEPVTDVRFVDHAYFPTLRIRLAEGGVFPPNEPSAGAPRVVISQSLARALWGRADPIGRRVSISLWGTTTAEVIGVVADVHRGDARTPPRPAVYLSANRFSSNERDVIVRGAGDPNAIVAALREVLRSIDATVPLYRATTLQTTVNETLAEDRLVTTLLSAFALLALALSAVGVHGVLSADVIRRRKEIGIRLALGAGRQSVYTFVFGQSIPAAIRGLILGLVAALLASRAMSALVFGIATWDLLSFGIVIGVLALVAVAATWLPAFLASRVSPLEAIRTD